VAALVNDGFARRLFIKTLVNREVRLEPSCYASDGDPGRNPYEDQQPAFLIDGVGLFLFVAVQSGNSV